MSRLFLDTNYLFDFIRPERPESDEAVTLFKQLQGNPHSACIAASSLKDLYYLMRKDYSEDERRDWIRAFIRAFDVEELDVEACAVALESDEPDYEDGCIRALAERAKVDFIITRDKKAFARSWVKAYSAREFNELFPNERMRAD